MKDKVVLAYSGGLDTSFLVRWLQEVKNVDVICVTVNTGGFEAKQLEEISARALKMGAAAALTIDGRDTYFREVISYLIKGNVLKGGVYPLCVGAERVTQARELARVASEVGAKAIAHGSTAAGNDQVRFEIYLRVLAPGTEIWAPVRDEGFQREEEVRFLKERGFEFSGERAKFSVNAGLWGKTLGCREIQNPETPVPVEAFQPITKRDPEAIQVEFDHGLPVALNGKKLPSVELIEALAKQAGAFGIGRGVHVGSTALGIKGRIAFEAPAAAVLLACHRELEKITLTKWELYWKAELSNFYGDMLHEGHFFEPVMREIEAFLDRSQERVSGMVKATLSPAGVWVDGCGSPHSLFRNDLGVYGEQATMWTGKDALGFAKIGSIPAVLAKRAGGK